MVKQFFVKDLEQGKKIDSVFSVKYKKPPRKYKRGWMFTLGLSDKTGEVEATYWGGENKEIAKKIYDQVEVGGAVQIKGDIGTYKKQNKINVQEQKGLIKKTEEFDIEDFVAKSEKDPEELLEKLKLEFSSIKEENILKLIQAFFKDEKFVKAFKNAPAAMFYHHAYMGGLLEHILNMISLSKTLKERYNSLDLDLLLFGCFIHDIGKIKEFKITTNIKQSRKGLLTGHITLGQEILLEKINNIENFPQNLKHKLLHIIISHHGEKEFGAVKPPMFPEAAAIYYLDNLDSKIRQYVDLKESAKTEDFHFYTKRFGQIYLD